jgi:hypothetical protein
MIRACARLNAMWAATMSLAVMVRWPTLASIHGSLSTVVNTSTGRKLYMFGAELDFEAEICLPTAG